MTVDEFVESKVLPEYRGIVDELRKLKRQHAPHVRELMSYGLPMYAQNDRSPGSVRTRPASLTALPRKGIRGEVRPSLRGREACDAPQDEEHG
jgi:hypothetical protein